MEGLAQKVEEAKERFLWELGASFRSRFSENPDRRFHDMSEVENKIAKHFHGVF